MDGRIDGGLYIFRGKDRRIDGIIIRAKEE